MIGRRISQPKSISQAQSRLQLAMFLANARDLNKVDIDWLERRFGLPRTELVRALAAARQVRGRLL